MPKILVGKITAHGYETSAETTESQKAAFADMLASRRPPQSLTDRELFAGVGTLGQQFSGDEKMLDKVVAVAKQNGYTPGMNDFYNAGLARFVGDPLGFIPPTGGRGHIEKVCRLTNRSVEGAVNYIAPQMPDPKPVRLAEDLVQKQMSEYVAENPDLQANLPKLREEVIEKHGAPESSE